MTQSYPNVTYAPGQCPVGTLIRPGTVQTSVSQRPSWLNSPRRQLCVLLRDGSFSMSGDKARQADQASRDLLTELAKPVNHDLFDGAVVDFSTRAEVKHPVIKATELVKILSPIAVGGSTNIHHALELALQLTRNQQVGNRGPVVVMFSDGEATEGGDPLPAAASLKQTGAVIVTVGYGDDADIDTLRAIATSPQHCYRKSATGDELRRFMASVGRTLTLTMNSGQDPSQTLGRL